jgi:hypothetical protein
VPACFDPLWLMARQWQVGEFQGEDAGMPVLARVRSQTTMLSRIHLGELPANTITAAAAYDPQVMAARSDGRAAADAARECGRRAHAAPECRSRIAFPVDARAAAAVEEISAAVHCAIRLAAAG